MPQSIHRMPPGVNDEDGAVDNLWRSISRRDAWGRSAPDTPPGHHRDRRTCAVGLAEYSVEVSHETLFQEVLKLTVDKRAELAAALLRSLDGEPDDDVEAAWAAEIQRRIHDVRSGNAKLASWQAVRDRARERLRAR